MFIEIMAHIVTIEYIIMEKYNISNKTMKEKNKKKKKKKKEQLKKGRLKYKKKKKRI